MTAQKKKPQKEEKEIFAHCYCCAEKREITPNECLSISASKRNNRKYCKESKCESLSHLCLSCVTYDDVDEDSIVKIPGEPLCEFHTVNGFFVGKCENLESLKIEIREQSKSIKNCIELRGSLQKNIESENILYVEFEKDTLFSEIENKDEIPPPLEEDEISEQELEIVLKQEDF